MSIKLDKILESMDSFNINAEVALLENEGLDALTVAQARKSIHESFKFIKSELIQGGILEETQNLLADAWTDAIMEDIHVPFIPEDDGFGMDDAALAAGGLAAAGGARYAVPALAKGVSKAAQIHGMGFDLKPSLVQGYRAAKGNFEGNLANDKAMYNNAKQFAADQVAAAKQSVANQVGAATAGYEGVQGPNKPGAGLAYSLGSAAGKVRRVFK